MRTPAYDEFAMLHENAAEYNLDFTPPKVRREYVELPSGLHLSALLWGAAPELVLIHGGGQNAHTWDTVALALDVSLVAVDLPGHGYSDHRPEHNYDPASMAADIAVAIQELAPNTSIEAVVGMSLGGLTAICLAADYPHLVPRLGIVDVTPGTDNAKAEPIINFLDGPESFASFDEILNRTIEHHPTRSHTSLRRGVLHNAHERPDGTWAWNYDPIRDWQSKNNTDKANTAPGFDDIWSKVSQLKMPVSLWQGGAWSVVSDDDVSEWLRRAPHTDHVVVEGAGHSIQGDQPLQLTTLIRSLMALDP